MIGILETVFSVMTPPEKFESLTDAFRAARAKQVPILAEVHGTFFDIQPDGTAQFIAKAPIQ